MPSASAPSPAWLGFGAAISFGCLVLAAFASGYYLVRSVPVEPVSAEPVPAPAAPAEP